MLLHPQVHDGDSLTDNHILLPQYATDDSPSLGNYDVMHIVYRRNHSRDSPSDKHETLPSDTLHQMVCCGPQEAIPGLMALSAPILSGIQVHPLYLPGIVHVPENTNSYNSSVLVG